MNYTLLYWDEQFHRRNELNIAFYSYACTELDLAIHR